MRNIYDLPPDLPRPVDDGGTDHLAGMELPTIRLESTHGELVDLSGAFQKPGVLFIYPRAGSPLEPNSNDELWDKTPGARGCTPQSCAFRDLYQEFLDLDVSVTGLSMQSPPVQKEFVERNHISFPVLSDHNYQLTNGLNLPTFTFEGERLIKRMALFLEGGKIRKVFYPVFPPDKNASTVLSWLKQERPTS
jgi:peroxiredoxin